MNKIKKLIIGFFFFVLMIVVLFIVNHYFLDGIAMWLQAIASGIIAALFMWFYNCFVWRK